MAAAYSNNEIFGYANINLSFYGNNQQSREKIDEDGEHCITKGCVFKQNLKLRIAQSNFALCLDYSVLKTETKFVASNMPGLKAAQIDPSIGELVAVAYQGSRGSRFTPDTGVDGEIVCSVYDKALSDRLTTAYWGVLAEAVNMPNRECRMQLIKPRQLARDKVKKERQKRG